MSQKIELQLAGVSQPRPFMSEEEYRAFAARFQRQVKPEMDAQREKRIRSEEAAKKLLIG